MVIKPSNVHNLLRHAKEFRVFLTPSSTRIGRAMALTFAYISTAAIIVGVLIYLQGILSSEILHGLLGYFFISSISAGIEPGSAKAQYLRAVTNVEVFRFEFPGLIVGAIGKAVLLSPILIAAWLLTNSGVLDTLAVIMWSPAILAIGFMTTEMRFALDINGRYTSAIWLKQGSLLIGLLGLVAGLFSGFLFQVAIAISLAMRIVWLAAFLVSGKKYLVTTQINRKSLFGDGMGGHWVQLALTSVLGAVGGSMDRIVAFNYLDASEANGYYITYEILSKFWLISYLLAPVVFSKRARYKDQSMFVGFAGFVIAVTGIIFISTVALVGTFWPQAVVYISNGFNANHGVSLFAGAIVIHGLSMVLNADLQGMGQTKAVTTITLLSMLVSAITFYSFTSIAALYGLFLAWFFKGAIELAMILGYLFYLRKKRNILVSAVAADLRHSSKLDRTKQPNFFVVGAAKAGTSSLGNYLSQHPEVYISPIKEPLFFSKDICRENFRSEYLMSVGSLDVNAYLSNHPLPRKPIAHIDDRAQYLELFREVECEKAIGELSTSYLYSNCAAENIFKFNSSAKIIMVLRQPVERAYSHYQMAIRDFVDFDYDFISALERDFVVMEKGWGRSHLYIELSLYFEQVRRYLDIFPEDQVKIFLYDDLKHDPVKFMVEIFEFLDVDASHVMTINLFEHKNVASFPRYKFSSRYEKLLNISRRYISAAPEGYKNLIRGMVFSNKHLPKLQRYEFDHAMKYFDEDIYKLSALIKRDLRNWYQYGMSASK